MNVIEKSRSSFRRGGAIAATAAFALTGLLFAAPAHASEGAGELDSDTVSQLLELNPGIDETGLVQSLESVAEAEGVTLSVVADQLLAEATSSADRAGTSLVARSGGSGTVNLGSATQIGDVFVSPAATLFVQHGHTGIYISAATIVEAPGTGSNSRSTAAATRQVGKGTVKQHVSTSANNRALAADKAKKFIGRGYNTNFAVNKTTTNGSQMNCSQLVWSAYKAAANVDLDGNGGLGVYPYDIRDSSLTSTYSTL